MDSKKHLSTNTTITAINEALESDGLGEIGCGPLCKVNYLSQRGEKIQLIRLLFLVFMPMAAVWAFTIFNLSDSIKSRTDFQTAKYSMKIVIRMGQLIHKLQKERDMTILYIGKLGPGTKTFLMRNYEETDKAFSKMDIWPPEFSNLEQQEFRTKHRLITYISQHRNQLDPDMTDTYKELEFYTQIANLFMSWMIENIRDAGFGAFWKSLVAYQKLTRCSLDAGAERAYGVMFYTRRNAFTYDDFERYNKRVHSFNVHFKVAVSYSPFVNAEALKINATLAIDIFRSEIRNAELNTITASYISPEKAEWLFDNLTIRTDALFHLQEQIAEKILTMLDNSIAEIGLQIAVYATIVVLAIGISPIIVFYSEFLTSSIARYSKVLLEKSSEIDEEKSKSDTILYQMIPKAVADRLKISSNIASEFFRSVTLMFSSIVNFSKLSARLSPLELVDMLNFLYTFFDEKIEDYDVYKVETINDTYLLASGLPLPNGEKHVSEIAFFAVDILRMVSGIGYARPMHGEQLQLLVGINTGSVSAGVIGKAMLRYCVFGDTVNIASRMMSNGAPNKIHISESTFKKLKKTGKFKIQSRGVINVKGKGKMTTYWLQGCSNNETKSPFFNLPGETESVREVVYLGSVAEETSSNHHELQELEIKYEPDASEPNQTFPTRRLSYSAMHVTHSSC